MAKAVWCFWPHICVCLCLCVSVRAMSHAIFNKMLKSFIVFSGKKTFPYSTQTGWEAGEERVEERRKVQKERDRAHLDKGVWAELLRSPLIINYSFILTGNSYKAIMNNWHLNAPSSPSPKNTCLLWSMTGQGRNIFPRGCTLILVFISSICGQLMQSPLYIMNSQCVSFFSKFSLSFIDLLTFDGQHFT